MAEVLADMAESVSRHPYMVAGGVAAILLLGLMGSRRPTAPGELSDDVKKSLIDADVQSQQIDAAARIANGQSRAGVQTAVAQARAGVAMAGIQANADQFGMRQSTIQNRDSIAGQRAIAGMETRTAAQLANINSDLQRQLQAADLQWQSWKAQYDDAYNRWELPRLLEYYSAQDMLAYKQARATAPYYAQQSQWLVRHGIQPVGFGSTFGASAGQSLGSQIGPILQSIIGAVGSYFGGSAGGAAGGAIGGGTAGL